MQINISSLPIVYINMDRQEDRNFNMIQIGKDLDFKNYSRVQGVDTPSHPIAGCASSHYNILKDISKPTVILEDDCAIVHKNKIIDIPDDADAVYLGLSNWGFLNNESKEGNYLCKKSEQYPNAYKVDGMLATHAILYISKEYKDMAARIAKWSLDNDRHIDQGLALIQKYFNVYALSIPMFYQKDNPTVTNFTLS